MPFYEFYCSENHTIYTFFARSTRFADRVPRCPDDSALPLRRMVSRFSVNRNRPEVAEGDSDALDDPALEEAFSEMEREFSSLDSNHPDPRDLGRLMRKMTEMTGEGLGGEMEEVIGRLEKGESPDRLEEEFGDVLDQAFGDESVGDGPGDLLTERLGHRLKVRSRRSARRDEQVYSMEDWLD